MPGIMGIILLNLKLMVNNDIRISVFTGDFIRKTKNIKTLVYIYIKKKLIQEVGVIPDGGSSTFHCSTY